MMQFILSLARVLPAARGNAQCEPSRNDPLAHPALQAMTQAQLGDLPIGHPAARQADCGC